MAQRRLSLAQSVRASGAPATPRRPLAAQACARAAIDQLVGGPRGDTRRRRSARSVVGPPRTDKPHGSPPPGSRTSPARLGQTARPPTPHAEVHADRRQIHRLTSRCGWPEQARCRVASLSVDAQLTDGSARPNRQLPRAFSGQADLVLTEHFTILPERPAGQFRSARQLQIRAAEPSSSDFATVAPPARSASVISSVLFTAKWPLDRTVLLRVQSQARGRSESATPAIRRARRGRSHHRLNRPAPAANRGSMPRREAMRVSRLGRGSVFASRRPYIQPRPDPRLVTAPLIEHQ